MPRFDEIPLIDGHLHPLLVRERAEARPFADFFTETDDEQVITHHVPYLRFYRRALRDLATLLDCDAELEQVVAARRALGPEALLRRCVEHGNVAALIVDDGYPAADAGMTPVQMAAAAGCLAPRILRLETLVAQLVVEGVAATAFAATLICELEAARAAGTVGLKSVVAYRCGLAFRLPTASETAAGLERERGRVTNGRVRVTEPDLLYHTLATALEWAGDRGLPVQVHSGFGDRDLNLPLANPALLRPLLEESRFNRCPLVLLHASYPYSREAGYLAGVYANVYVDWSEANPLLPGPVLVRVLEELLALAPATKLLYGSDAWGIPDWIYLGARYGREALAAALDGDPDADALARRILHDNAAELYELV